jgi:hypothetical protein
LSFTYERVRVFVALDDHEVKIAFKLYVNTGLITCRFAHFCDVLIVRGSLLLAIIILDYWSPDAYISDDMDNTLACENQVVSNMHFSGSLSWLRKEYERTTDFREDNSQLPHNTEITWLLTVLVIFVVIHAWILSEICVIITHSS